MKAEERRQAVREDLRNASSPLPAARLAARYSVSRQIIVGDIALLRAEGENILSTPRGYIHVREENDVRRTIACMHASEQMEDELNIMVDNGCCVRNVIVEHPVYGQLEGQLNIQSRHDVQEFIRRVQTSDAPPLSSLTAGIHLHTLSCPDDECFERVRQQLAQAGYLYEARG